VVRDKQMEESKRMNIADGKWINLVDNQMKPWENTLGFKNQ
jgi:hypothetical protein